MSVGGGEARDRSLGRLGNQISPCPCNALSKATDPKHVAGAKIAYSERMEHAA